jgi:hypothetical protein
LEATLDISWAAGILEGEGCFSFHRRKDRPNVYSCAIHCEMTDQDTINSLQKILGVGNICFRTNEERGNRKPSWIFSIQKREDVFDTLIKILPYLHTRRSEKIKPMFDYLEDKLCNVN